ncbi:MAG: hypothetical protein R2932_59910 [Caldilineaceae bacterium]
MHAGGRACLGSLHHRHQHHHAPAIAANRGGVRGAGTGFPNNYALIFAAAGVLFVLSIIPGLFFNELPGGKAVEKIPALREFVPALGRVLCDDGPFRAFILVRMFTKSLYDGRALLHWLCNGGLGAIKRGSRAGAGGDDNDWQSDRGAGLHLARRTQQPALYPAGAWFGSVDAALRTGRI